jgi:D-alanyl-D-alanine carboxypeptidase/D-alanyl-D-alanine carboxypeptidase (penicillin-binding protein 5/6)
MDADSGRVLYEQNADEPRLIASITKLMTALVALESGHRLDEMVTIQPEWAGAEGSSLYLQAGEQVTLETLLYGMLLRSGNDAALSVAGYCGGDVPRFVAQMNRKAEELGMTNSHFANPNGLNAEGHYSTAYDMALLARACLRNEDLARMVATKSITLGTRTFTNHNKLLWRYEGCIGLKTGFTEKAGRTLVSAARREGLTLICVTLNAPNDWADHAALLDEGFANYQVHTPIQAGDTLCRLPVEGSLLSFCPVTAQIAVSVPLAQGEQAQVSLSLDVPSLTAPVTAGTQVGEAVVTLNGQELGRTPLVTGEISRDMAPKQGLFAKWQEEFFGREAVPWKNGCKN